MFDVVIVVGLLALLGFCVGVSNGWRAGLENMVMFLLGVAAYFGMVVIAVKVVLVFLTYMGGWEMIHQL